MIITFCIIFALAGIGVGLWGVKRPIKIEYYFSGFDWCIPIVISFILFLVAFVGELLLSVWISDMIEVQDILDICIKKVVDNGLIIILLSALLSRTFEFLVEKLNLDYLELYSEKVSKWCFTILIAVSCILCIYRVKNYQDISELFFQNFINRLLMWMLTVVGTWIGLGYRCEGRITRNNRKRETLVKPRGMNAQIRFWMPIAWPLVGCIILLALYIFGDSSKFLVNEMVFCLLILCFALAGIISIAIYRYFMNPSEEKSEDNFINLLNVYDKMPQKKIHFGRNVVSVRNKELHIEKVNVEYPGHENEEDYIKLFGEKTVEFANEDEMLKYLKKRCKKQDEYIKNGFSNCLEELKEKQLVSIERRR